VLLRYCLRVLRKLHKLAWHWSVRPARVRLHSSFTSDGPDNQWRGLAIEPISSIGCTFPRRRSTSFHSAISWSDAAIMAKFPSFLWVFRVFWMKVAQMPQMPKRRWKHWKRSMHCSRDTGWRIGPDRLSIFLRTEKCQ
jgi:hypothetical protein